MCTTLTVFPVLPLPPPLPPSPSPSTTSARQCTNPNAKEKFQQISIAYTKLISAQSVGGKRMEDDNDEDGKNKRGDESHEMAAFMRMFMDLVGIFNEDHSLSEDGAQPLAGCLLLVVDPATDLCAPSCSFPSSKSQRACLSA